MTQLWKCSVGVGETLTVHLQICWTKNRHLHLHSSRPPIPLHHLKHHQRRPHQAHQHSKINPNLEPPTQILCHWFSSLAWFRLARHRDTARPANARQTTATVRAVETLHGCSAEENRSVASCPRLLSASISAIRRSRIWYRYDYESTPRLLPTSPARDLQSNKRSRRRRKRRASNYDYADPEEAFRARRILLRQFRTTLLSNTKNNNKT